MGSQLYHPGLFQNKLEQWMNRAQNGYWHILHIQHVLVIFPYSTKKKQTKNFTTFVSFSAISVFNKLIIIKVLYHWFIPCVHIYPINPYASNK